MRAGEIHQNDPQSGGSIVQTIQITISSEDLSGLEIRKLPPKNSADKAMQAQDKAAHKSEAKENEQNDECQNNPL
jgi:hypothetical protein